MSGLPLAGRRIVVTRQASKAKAAIDSIAALGGIPIALPAIAIDRSGRFPEFEAALRDMGRYDFVIVTSSNAATALVEGLAATADESGAGGSAPRAWTCVAIGRATARVLEAANIAVGIVPTEALSAKIAACLGELRGKRVFVPTSDLAFGDMTRELRALGAAVDEVIAYRTIPVAADPEALRELGLGADAVLFTSPSTVLGFDAMTLGRYRNDASVIACIGPVTALEARKAGYRVDLVPAAHDMEGLLDSLVEHWRPALEGPAKDQLV